MAGISLAPADTALTASPTWERIDTSYNVTSWQIDRGRQNEMTRTDTGTATIQLVDRVGAFDPTNATGHFFGRLTAGEPMGPLVQARIELQNPVTSAWSTLFRGFISRLEWVPYQTEQFANVTLDLVDGLAYLAACEMAPNGDFGDEVLNGNICFYEDPDVDAVQTRINKALDQAHWPSSLREIFTGNVSLWGLNPAGSSEALAPYAPRSSVLSVIQDAADAEFPDVANVYIGKTGNLTFHGRKARFNPADASYHIATWQCGDDAYAAAYPSTVVRVSPPLVASLDDTLLYTSALATSVTTVDEAIGGQYVTDPAYLKKGLRTWSAESLLTRTGEGGSTANVETKKFANYVAGNYNRPRVRVGQLTIKSRRPSSVNGPATWALLCGIDISDIVQLTTTHAGGGGFADPFYVEGIHYTARPGGGVPYVELALDVSPKGYYDSNPWA